METKDKDNLKSAYDLAMERLAGKGGDLVALSPEQKKQIAELAGRTKAKIAETQILYGKRIAEALAAEDAEKAQKIEDEQRREIERLRAREAEDKNRIRNTP